MPMENKLSIVLFVLAIQSTALYGAMIAAYGLCSPITIVLIIFSAALWIWVSILYIKRRAVIGDIALWSDLNLIMAAAVVVTLLTLTVLTIAGLAALNIIQCR